MVSNEVGQPGFNFSGYTNVSTSDGIVHGQVKQSGAFSFVRIYESGHVSIMNVQVLHFESISEPGRMCWKLALLGCLLAQTTISIIQAVLIAINYPGGTILSAGDRIDYL